MFSGTICLLIVSGTVTIIVPLAIEKIIGIIYTSDYSYLKENMKSWCNVLMGALFTGGLFNFGLAYLTNIPELKHLMKSLRANKYTRMFSHLNLAQMLVLNDENFDTNLEHIGTGTNAFAARRKIILVAKKLNELCSNLYDIVQNTINGEKLTSSIEEKKVNNDDSSNLDEEEYNNKKFEFSSISVKLFGKAFTQLFITGMPDDETVSTMYKLLDKVIQSNPPETQQKEVSSDTRLQSGQHYRRKKLNQKRILTDTQVTQKSNTKSENYPIPPVYNNRKCIRELQSQAHPTKKINLEPIFKEFYCAEPWGKHVTENALEYARHSDFVEAMNFKIRG
uniref:Uncharacterized protein n=1 Tax=Clastoptera arizonana TaxID=38151 RepID=A0A1B6DP51_9HEMI